MRSAECGIDASTFIPHSAFHIPLHALPDFALRLRPAGRVHRSGAAPRSRREPAVAARARRRRGAAPALSRSARPPHASGCARPQHLSRDPGETAREPGSGRREGGCAGGGGSQTVYAEHAGGVAAPTAGLHFTPELLARLAATGVAIARLDLHIGPGTFKPVAGEELERHVMHDEAYTVSEEAALAINTRRAAGGQVWAVGTTVVRTLETLADEAGRVRAGAGETRLFIHPPYRFRAVDRLLTNFHLPRSTPVVLVGAV